MTRGTGVDLSPVASLRSAGIPAGWLVPSRCDEHARRLDAGADPERTTAAAVAAADAGLARVAGQPAFALAVASADPRVHDTTLVPFASGESRKRRQRRRALAALLQRFATKNDTANGYGPMDRLEFAGDDLVRMPASRPGECAQRSGTLSWWFVAQLAERVARDPAVTPLLRDRLHSLVVLTPDGVRAGDRTVRLPPAVVARLAGDPSSLDERVLRGLRRAGVLRRDLLVPPALHDPAAWLAERLAELPGDAAQRWRSSIDGLRARAAALTDAPPAMRSDLLAALESCCADLVPAAGERTTRQQFYADRTVVFEEGRGADSSYRVGGALLVRLREQLAVAARLASVYGYQRFLDAADRLYAELGGQRTSLVAVSGAVARIDARGPGAWEGPRARRLRRALGLAVEEGAVLRPQRVLELLDDFPRPAVSLASPDVLFRRPPGRPAGAAEAVLGELHAGLHVMGPLEHFWRDDRRLREWADRGLAAAGRPLWQVVAPRSQGKAFGQQLPVGSILYEASACEGPSVRFAEVDVGWRDGEPWLEALDGTAGQLVPTDPDNPLYRALSPCAAELPALDVPDGAGPVRLGELVLQRRRWRVSLPDPGPATLPARWSDARRLRAHHRLPEQVFVRFEGVRKPFYLDFRDPLLVDLFWHWARGRRGATVTELMPRFDELWLDRAGQRICSEIRCSLILSMPA